MARVADEVDRLTDYTHEDNTIREIWDDLREGGYGDEEIRASILKLRQGGITENE